MRMERSLSVLAAAVLGGWLIAVLLCNVLFYRNIVNYEVLYQGIAGCWSKGSELDRTRRIWLLAVRILQAAVVYVMMRSRLRRSASLFLGLAAGGVRRNALKSAGMEPRRFWRLSISGFRFSAGSGLSAQFLSAADLWTIGPPCAERTSVLYHDHPAGSRDLDGALRQSVDLEIVLKKYNTKFTTC